MKYTNVTNSNIIADLKDYMFTSTNMDIYSKHMIGFLNEFVPPKSSTKNIRSTKKCEQPHVNKTCNKVLNQKKQKETTYKPRQKDSLFWCFYILKNGFSNYEMEINNQYFTVEKNEKFKYIDLLRKNKDILKLHKIKPLTELEDDLANKDKISVKTFFALCILEGINVLLIDKRKVYESLSKNIDNNHPINVVHRNSQTYEHFIELDATNETIEKYRNSFHKITSFNDTLKSMSAYKIDELLDLCNKLDINIEAHKKDSNKKMTKKDIYELLVLKY